VWGSLRRSLGASAKQGRALSYYERVFYRDNIFERAGGYPTATAPHVESVAPWRGHTRRSLWRGGVPQQNFGKWMLTETRDKRLREQVWSYLRECYPEGRNRKK